MCIAYQNDWNKDPSFVHFTNEARMIDNKSSQKVQGGDKQTKDKFIQHRKQFLYFSKRLKKLKNFSIYLFVYFQYSDLRKCLHYYITTSQDSKASKM